MTLIAAALVVVLQQWEKLHSHTVFLTFSAYTILPNQSKDCRDRHPGANGSQPEGSGRGTSRA